MCEREKCDIALNSDRIESIVLNKYEAVCTKSDRATDIAMKILPYIINDTLIQIRFVDFRC
jgi:DNA-directed RNA polymerase subunit K/omega